jgi:putative RecB family exonuclease
MYSFPADARTLKNMKHVAKELWEGEYKEKVIPYVKGDDALRMFRWSSWWCVEKLFEMEEPTSLHFDGIETELNDSIDGVAIKGFIDRWRRTDDGIVVGDYKTGKTPAPRYREDKYFQLLLYAYVLEKQLNEQVKEIELLFIKDGVRLHKTVTDEDREEVRSTVVSVRKQIEDRCKTGEFEPIKHKLCDWCHFKPMCPIWSKK